MPVMNWQLHMSLTITYCICISSWSMGLTGNSQRSESEGLQSTRSFLDSMHDNIKII